MRLIGWILLLAGAWSVWDALVGRTPVSGAGVVMVVVGLGLLTRRGRAAVAWVGEGVLTGLCLTGGLLLVALGALAALPTLRLVGDGLPVPLGMLVVPALFAGCGILLIAAAGRRLARQYRSF